MARGPKARRFSAFPGRAAVIYLDNLASTPIDPRVKDLLLRALDVIGNPHSDHFAGGVAAGLIVDAREEVSNLIRATPEEVVFTSGATEANNLAILGTCRDAPPSKRRIVSCTTEHKAVLGPLDYLQSELGWQVELVRVDRDGRLDWQQLTAALEDTYLVSIMAANNETGVIHPVSEIGRLCRQRGVLLHCDASQAVGKVPVNVREWQVDYLSLSAHKIYGPVGVGALFIADDAPVRPRPLFFGGGQEGGLRPGTTSAALCAALGEACRLAALELAADALHQRGLADRFLRALREHVPAARLNAAQAPRLPGALSVVLPGVDVDHLIGALQPHIAVSSTSACTAGHMRRSHVLAALGLPDHEIAASLRVGFGRGNSAADADEAAEAIGREAVRLLGSNAEA